MKSANSPLLALVAMLLVTLPGPAGARKPVRSGAAAAATALLDRQVVPRQSGQLAPRDDCSGIPGARAFRLAVARAAVARDTNALAALTRSDVQLGFGGDNGIAWLRRNANARDGAFWTNFTDALALGCAVHGDGSIAMPWVYAQDSAPLEPFDAILVRGAQVPLRAAPSATAKVLQTLDWQFVEFVGPWQADAEFVKVRSADKTEGYIAMSAQRGATETRIIADRTPAGWKITAIVAGD